MSDDSHLGFIVAKWHVSLNSGRGRCNHFENIFYACYKRSALSDQLIAASAEWASDVAWYYKYFSPLFYGMCCRYK